MLAMLHLIVGKHPKYCATPVPLAQPNYQVGVETKRLKVVPPHNSQIVCVLGNNILQFGLHDRGVKDRATKVDFNYIGGF